MSQFWRWYVKPFVRYRVTYRQTNKQMKDMPKFNKNKLENSQTLINSQKKRYEGGGDHWWRWCKYWKFLSEWHLISLVSYKILEYLKYPVIARLTSYNSALFHHCNPSIKWARIFITFFDLLILKTVIRFNRFNSFWTTGIWNVNFVLLLETSIHIESPPFFIGFSPIPPLSMVQIS